MTNTHALVRQTTKTYQQPNTNDTKPPPQTPHPNPQHRPPTPTTPAHPRRQPSTSTGPTPAHNRAHPNNHAAADNRSRRQQTWTRRRTTQERPHPSQTPAWKRPTTQTSTQNKPAGQNRGNGGNNRVKNVKRRGLGWFNRSENQNRRGLGWFNH